MIPKSMSSIGDGPRSSDKIMLRQEYCRPARPDSMSDILFIKTSSLGDVIHHMPAVTDARRHRPDARLTWVVEEAFAPLARLHPAIDEVIAVSSRRWRSHLVQPATWSEISAFKARLRAVNAEKVVDTQGLIRSALIARTADGERHGYDAASIREPVASWFYDVKHTVARNQHAVARNRILTGKWLRGQGVGIVLPWGNEAERMRCERLAAAIPGSRILERQPLDATA